MVCGRACMTDIPLLSCKGEAGRYACMQLLTIHSTDRSGLVISILNRWSRSSAGVLNRADFQALIILIFRLAEVSTISDAGSGGCNPKNLEAMRHSPRQSKGSKPVWGIRTWGLARSLPGGGYLKSCESDCAILILLHVYLCTFVPCIRSMAGDTNTYMTCMNLISWDFIYRR